MIFILLIVLLYDIVEHGQYNKKNHTLFYF